MNFIKNESKIYICDIGASPCDPTEHLEDLLKNTDSFLYGFEPSEKEFNKLKQLEQKDKKKFFQKAIGDGSEKTLNSSFFTSSAIFTSFKGILKSGLSEPYFSIASA